MDEAVVTGPLADPITNRPVIIVAAPILEVPGTVVLSLELDSLGAGLDAELGDRMPPSSFRVSAGGADLARSDSLPSDDELIRSTAAVPG